MTTRTFRAAAALLLSVGVLARAEAIPMLRLTTDTADTITIGDGLVGDVNAATGAVTFVGPVGLWNINVTAGLSKPILGSPESPLLHLTSMNMTSSGLPGSITIELTDTDFTVQDQARVLAGIGGMAEGNVTFRTFFDETNTAFGQGTELTSQSFSSGPFSGSAGTSLTALGLYSLTMLVTISHDGQPWQASSFDATIHVPEPSTIALLGAGLLVIGFAARRKIAAAASV